MSRSEYVELMSERVLGERLSANEPITLYALENRQQLRLGEDIGREEIEDWALSTIRTAAIYILQDDAIDPPWDEFLQLVKVRETTNIQEMPPLPFPRMVIEAEKDGKPVPFHMMAKANEDTGVVICIQCLVISEIERGSRWDVVIVVEIDGKQDYFPLGLGATDAHLLTSMIEHYNIKDNEDLSFLQYSVWMMKQMIIHMVNMATVRNAPREHVQLPRQQRRGFKRKHGVEHPQVYRIRLNRAGDPINDGVSGWHYRVRFLVCGHWRHYQDGRKAWVQPYIKGPMGAPWKGRPVHETEPTEVSNL